MTDEGLTHPRPSQVTVGGWTIVGAAALLVPSAFDGMSRLRSVETREAFQKQFGADNLEAVTETARVALLVGGAASAMVAILAFFALRGDKAARLATTALALVVLPAGMLSGPFLSALVLAGVAMLWTGAARDWFAGREPRQPRLPVRESAPTPAHVGAPDAEVRVTTPVTAAPPRPGFGDPAPAVPQPWPYVAPTGRPPQVQTAAIVTWVVTGMTALFGLMVLFSMLVQPAMITDAGVDMFETWGLTLGRDTARSALIAGAVVMILWSGAAALLAGLALRRQAWARTALVACACLSALAGAFAFPVSVLHLAASAWVVGLLLAPATRAWFRSGPE